MYSQEYDPTNPMGTAAPVPLLSQVISQEYGPTNPTGAAAPGTLLA